MDSKRPSDQSHNDQIAKKTKLARYNISAYPFAATRTQVWREVARDSRNSTLNTVDPSVVLKLPDSLEDAKSKLHSVSLQQAIAVRYLKNCIVNSYAGGGISVFHLGGLAGAGKTTMVKELIAELNDARFVDSTCTEDILLCCKSNSAVASLMTACKVDETSLLYNPTVFSTINKGFAIPVVHNKSEITPDKINYVVSNLCKRVSAGLFNLKFFVVDEYTMSGCRDVVFIDAILRIVKLRPDIPFGGVCVILLGDNRQNSAVVEDSSNRAQVNIQEATTSLSKSQIKANVDENEKRAEDEDDMSTFEAGCVEEEKLGNGNEAKLYTEVFTRVLKTFCDKSHFGNGRFIKNIINKRIETLSKKLNQVTVTNNDIVSSFENKVVEENIKKPHGGDDGVVTCNVKEEEEVGDEEDSEFDDDFSALFADGKLLERMERKAIASSSNDNDVFMAIPRRDYFSRRARKIFDANEYCKKQQDNSNRVAMLTSNEEYAGSLDVLGKLPLSALIEEGMTSEMDHLLTLKNLTLAEVEKHTENIGKIVIEMAIKAMTEIDYSGREKLYIVSSLSERFKDAHVTSLMDQELLNAKIVLGNDEKCIDAVPFHSNHTRNKALAACIRNAFFRDGRDVKDQLPICIYFKKNLDSIASFVASPSLSFHSLKEKSLEICDALVSFPSSTISYAAVKQGRTRVSDEGDCDVDDEFDEDYYDDDDKYNEINNTNCIYNNNNNVITNSSNTISRDDIPNEIGCDLSTSERVGVMVDFHVTWNNWLKQCNPSDVVRARIWYLYLLVRIQQIKFDTGELPSLDKSSFYGRLFFKSSEWPNLSREGDDNTSMYEEYWLRALSMPVSSGGDASQHMLLPAYSSYLSAVSRTYIMCSLKRIDAVIHAYSLMYAISLLDMTVSLPDLIDVRKVFSKSLDEKQVDPMLYFGSIFPSIVSEFLMQSRDDVLNTVMMMERVEGSLKVSKLIKDVLTATQNTKFSAKPILMAMQMLTSISKGNLRHRNMQGNEETKSRKSLAETLSSKVAAAVTSSESRSKKSMERMMGAITLTKKHSQKNAVSHLVDMSISTQTSSSINPTRKGSEGANNETPHNANAIKATKCDVRFVVKNMDLTYIGYDRIIRPDHRSRIVELINKLRYDRRNYLFDASTDNNLLRESLDLRKFTSILLGVRNKVTRAKSVIIYQGQNVVFTTTNNALLHIHGATEKFVTKDTGVVTDINITNGELVVSVFIERLGGIVRLKEGHHTLGTGIGNNAYVKYLPIESSQAMTIYSCQGHTFFRDTVVDLSGASTQDAYVSITRNSNPLNLYIVEMHTTDRKNLSNLKYSMSKDRPSIMPIGGLGALGGDAFINYDHVNVAHEVLSAIQYDNGKCSSLMYSVLDPTRDVVSAAQEFILSRSGSILAFNALWVANTGKVLQQTGLETELNRIREFFLPHGKDFGFAEYYEKLSHKKIVELYTAVIRSTTHYAIASNLVKTPSNKMMDEYEIKHKNKRDYIKFHPSFLNRSPKESTVSTFLYDVAPHSVTVKILQFYIHYLFLVYERLHICNASFAFLPAPTPLLNHYVRARNLTKMVMVPGLAYESKDFITSEDGGERDKKWRVAVTAADYVSDNIISMLSDAENEAKAAEYTEYACKSMKHNMRRSGKFCRPHEACGLSKHGAIVTSIENKDGVQNIHYADEKGWLSMADEANLYCLLIFMTKLAAASGVTSHKVVDRDFLELNKNNNGNSFIHQSVSKCTNLQLRLSSDFLWCGQVYPMKRVQFSLHARRSGSNCTTNLIPEQLFSRQFEKFLCDKRLLYGVKALAIVEMMGHEFASYSTSEMRMNVYSGIGNVVDILVTEGEGDVEEGLLMTPLNNFIKRNIENILISGGGKRVSFFVSCSLK